jgi:hypothetical protein
MPLEDYSVVGSELTRSMIRQCPRLEQTGHSMPPGSASGFDPNRTSDVSSQAEYSHESGPGQNHWCDAAG